MSTITALTEQEVRAFVDEWYHALDIHVPPEELLAMVADEGIEFRFPEETVTDKEGLNRWYVRILNSFFDETHETKELAITTTGDQAEVKILTLWQARFWASPAPQSEQLAFHAWQTWKVKRSPISGKPVIVSYIVDSFQPVGNTGALPVKQM